MDSKLSETPTSPSVSTPPPPAHPARRINLDLSLAQVAGGALAAATAAALSSRLGVAGTIVGAAVISIITAVAGALYTQSLHHTQSLRRTRSHVRAVAQVARRRADLDVDPAKVPPAARLELRPRRVLAGVVVIFALAVAGITGLEILAGHPLSGGTAGTTVGELAGGGSSSGSAGTEQGPAVAPTSDGDPRDPALSSNDPTSVPTDPPPNGPEPTGPEPNGPAPTGPAPTGPAPTEPTPVPSSPDPSPPAPTPAPGF